MASLLVTAAQKEVPKTYKFPPGSKPVCVGRAEVSTVDLEDRNNLIQNMMKAFQEFGFFKVVNHGVSTDLMKDATNIFKELFDLPPEEITKMNKEEDVNKICRIYTSTVNFDTEETHHWRMCLRMQCHPLEECVKYWPNKPDKYREITSAYVVELKKLGSMILEQISQGLGLEKTYLENKVGDHSVLNINGFPACPDPSLTLGLSKHKDASLISILHSGHVPGLLVLIDDQWLSVDTPPDAFLIFIGNILEVVSNGKMRSPTHMVVNTSEARISSAFFMIPSKESMVEPAKKLIEAQNERPLYKPFKFEDYYQTYIGRDGDRDSIIEDSFKSSS